jgi:hypothetical protein
VSFGAFSEALLDRMLELAEHEKVVDNIMTTEDASFNRMSRFLLGYHKRLLTEKRRTGAEGRR